jgi:hypothetical protein
MRIVGRSTRPIAIARQFLGAEDPQCWRRQRPERARALSLLTYSLVWHWYLVVHGSRPAWQRKVWYEKATPSFLDALAQARRELWWDRMFVESDRGALSQKFQAALIETLAYVACVNRTRPSALQRSSSAEMQKSRYKFCP